jgi:hypothetical protein
VERMVDWRTAGSMAPGVQRGSALENSPEPRARQEPGGGWGWTTCAEAWLTASAGSEARDAAGAVPAATAVGLASATATSSAAPAASRIAIALHLLIVSHANARLGPQLRSGADTRPREVGPRSECFGASSHRVSRGVAARPSFAHGDLVLLSRDAGSRRR